MVRRELPTAAGGDGQKSADSVEKVGLPKLPDH
jgi:hypothetical protein